MDLHLRNNHTNSTDVDHIDRSLVSELQEIMADDFHQLLKTFCQDSISRIDTIDDLINELMDADSILATTYSNIARTVHGFKGSASSIGAYRLSQKCRDMEYAARAQEKAELLPLYNAIKQEYLLVQQCLNSMEHTL